MDENRFRRTARDLMDRSKADQMFSLGDVLRQAAQQDPDGGGQPAGQGKRGDGSPAGRPGRKKKVQAAPRIRLYPTNSHRLNRALVELTPMTFKVHQLLWQWRGAPSRGSLPSFTIKSVARFCATDRKVVRRAMIELTTKGWIEQAAYDKHHKNRLYKLVPIKNVRVPYDRRTVRRAFDAESAPGAAALGEGA